MAAMAEAITARQARALTKSDTAILAPTPIALYVGTEGNVAVRTAGQDTVTFVAVPAGTILPVVIDKLLSTGTTASNIVGLNY